MASIDPPPPTYTLSYSGAFTSDSRGHRKPIYSPYLADDASSSGPPPDPWWRRVFRAAVRYWGPATMGALIGGAMVYG